MTNEEHKAEWVAALRSGKYEQARSALRTKDDKFCCLGVAGDLAGCEQVLNGAQYLFDGQTKAFLPHRAADWLGVSRCGGLVYLPNAEKVYLYDLNDRGFTFDQIADIIENGELL